MKNAVPCPDKFTQVYASLNPVPHPFRHWTSRGADSEITQCDHVMGFSCISTWLLQNNGRKNNTCPYCRKEFFDLPWSTREFYESDDDIVGTLRTVSDLGREMANPDTRTRPGSENRVVTRETAQEDLSRARRQLVEGTSRLRESFPNEDDEMYHTDAGRARLMERGELRPEQRPLPDNYFTRYPFTNPTFRTSETRSTDSTMLEQAVFSPRDAPGQPFTARHGQGGSIREPPEYPTHRTTNNNLTGAPTAGPEDVTHRTATSDSFSSNPRPGIHHRLGSLHEPGSPAWEQALQPPTSGIREAARTHPQQSQDYVASTGYDPTDWSGTSDYEPRALTPFPPHQGPAPREVPRNSPITPSPPDPQRGNSISPAPVGDRPRRNAIHPGGAFGPPRAHPAPRVPTGFYNMAALLDSHERQARLSPPPSPSSPPPTSYFYRQPTSPNPRTLPLSATPQEVERLSDEPRIPREHGTGARSPPIVGLGPVTLDRSSDYEAGGGEGS